MQMHEWLVSVQPSSSYPCRFSLTGLFLLLVSDPEESLSSATTKIISAHLSLVPGVACRWCINHVASHKAKMAAAETSWRPDREKNTPEAQVLLNFKRRMMLYFFSHVDSFRALPAFAFGRSP